MLDDYFKASPGVNDLARLVIEPRSSYPQSVAIAMSFQDAPSFANIIQFLSREEIPFSYLRALTIQSIGKKFAFPCESSF